MGTINILLAEDHNVVREGLRAFLETTEDVRVVGEARNGREAVQLARKLHPTIIVMDVAMPRLNGTEATRQILLENPGAKVLALSASSSDEQVVRMIQTGAVGFVEKQSAGRTLLRAIREVAGGHPFFSPGVDRHLRRIGSPTARRRRGAAPAGRLTPRQLEILQLVAEGAPNKAIAAELGISIKTVDKHRQQMMAKLDIHDTAGLTRYAVSTGIVDSKV